MKILAALSLLLLILLLGCSEKDPSSSEPSCGDGDINQNGISLEIADLVVMTRYFVEGLSAFEVNSIAQSHASDINCDGKYCTVPDLVHMIRLVVGDAMPWNPGSAGELGVTYDGHFVGFDNEAGAALFVFEGNANIDIIQLDLDIKVGNINGNTHALVYDINGSFIHPGNVLNVRGGDLISVEAADFNGNPYHISFHEAQLYFNCFPNPFYTSTTLIVDLPRSLAYTITIKNAFRDIVKVFEGEGVGHVMVEWDAEDMAEGIYIATLKANGKIVSLPLLHQRH